MQPLSIPACYFPSTALFLDDNRDFLLNFVLQLDEGLAYRIYDDPHQALNYIHRQQNNPQMFSNRCTQTQGTTDYIVNSHAGLAHEVYNPHRFAEISAVVIDYDMPGMNGLDFSRQLQHSAIKTILLTGKADEKIAIGAFNEGIIHRYIKKSDVNASELVTKSLIELQQRYFHQLSDAMMLKQTLYHPACLHDSGFINFFRQLLVKNNIVEYYLLDTCGSYVMFDDDARISYLIIRTEADREQCYQQACTHGVSQVVCDSLSATGQSISHLTLQQLNSLNPEEWQATLLPAIPLTDNNSIYYSYVQDQDLFNIGQKKILSYNRFLEELDAEELLGSSQ